MMSSENKQHLKKAIKGLVTEEWAGQRDSEAPRDHQEREAGTHPPGPRAWGREYLLGTSERHKVGTPVVALKLRMSDCQTRGYGVNKYISTSFSSILQSLGGDSTGQSQLEARDQAAGQSPQICRGR